VRATEQPGPRGFDGEKRVTGIKWHVGVDTLGLVWGLAVTTADVADCKAARLAVTEAKTASDRLMHVWADAAYQGFIEFALVLLDLAVAIVTRRPGTKGFEVLPRRRVMERTFGWLTQWQRLNRNYEHALGGRRAVVQVALIGIMARRLGKTHNRCFPNRH
jgi:transposase